MTLSRREYRALTETARIFLENNLSRLAEQVLDALAELDAEEEG